MKSMGKLRALLTLAVITTINAAAVGNTSEADVSGGGCKAIHHDDTTVTMVCPDSSIVKAKIVGRKKRYIIAENPYLGRMRLSRNEIAGEQYVSEYKERFRYDPMCDKTFINQTAYIRKRYPIGTNVLDGIFTSLDATITPTTQIYLNVLLPGLDYFYEYTVALKQQILLLSKQNLGCSLFAAFTHPLNNASEDSNPIYVANAKALFSYEFFDRGFIHAGVSYTLQKKYEEYREFIDGTRHYNFDEYFYNEFGFSFALEMQPFRSVKFMAEITDDYGGLVDEDHMRTYLLAVGSRLIFPRFVLDIACGGILFGSKYSGGRILPFPILRGSWFLGRFKDDG